MSHQTENLEKGNIESKNELPSKKNGLFMDEALTKTRFGVFNYIAIFLTGLIFTDVLMETSSIQYILPVSQCDLRLTAGERGILSASTYFGIICSSHLWGFLADTKGRRSIMIPTLFITFIFSCASSLCQNFYLLLAFRILNGFFMSGPAATIYAYLGELHDDKQRDRAIMGASIIFGVSCLSMPLLAWGVINQSWQFYIPYLDIIYKPWRFYFIVSSLPGLLAFFILLFYPESPKFVLGQGNQTEAYQILCKINRINNGKSSQLEEFEIVEEPESIANRDRILKCKNSRFPFLSSVYIQTAPLFQSTYLCRTILICTIQFAVYFTWNGYFMRFSEVLNKMAISLDNFVEPRISMCEVINMKPNNLSSAILQNDLSNEVCVTKLEMDTYKYGFILESLFAIGFILIGILINRIGKFPIMFFILVVSGSSGIASMLFRIPLAQIYSFIALLCSGMAANVMSAATVELYPTASRGMAVSISLMFGRIGCVLGAIYSALLLESHCEIVFYSAGFGLLVIAILTYFIPNIHKRGKDLKGVNE